MIFGKSQPEKPHLVVVDFSNYVYTCWYPAVQAEKANPALYDAKRVLITNLEGKLGTLRRDLEEVAGITDYDLVFVEDRTSLRKYELYPLYKANREAQEYDPRPAAKEWLKGRVFCHSPDNEADDAIATLVAQNSHREVIIASSDKDLWQLIGPRVHVYRITKGCFVDPLQIEDAFGVQDPKLIPLVKALWGDSGDNVPNAVPRMQKQLLPIVELAKSEGADLPALQRSIGLNVTNLTKRCKELLVQGWNQVSVNYALVKLDTGCELIWERT